MATESSLMANSGFSVAPNDFRIVHPLSASPATSAFYPPNSSSPPPSQQLNSNGTSNASNAEDVTTIFVVGFPDDMQEREFQNMFTFSPGFEAASLKWHCKDQDDDYNSGGNGSGATTPASAAAVGGKKQMIGFARFRTRLEALEAVEVLSGKKIDTEKGAVLKAEMAKKNLHIKRGSIVPTAIQSGGGGNGNGGSSATAVAAQAAAVQAAAVAAAAAQAHQQVVAAAAAAAAAANHHIHPSSSEPATGRHISAEYSVEEDEHAHHPAVYDAFSPLPSDLLSPVEYKSDPFNDALMSTPTTPSFNDTYFSLRSQSFDARSPNHDLVVSPRAFNLYPRSTRMSMHPLMPQPPQPQQQQQQDLDMNGNGNNNSGMGGGNDPFGSLGNGPSVIERHNSMSAAVGTSYFDNVDSLLGSRMGSLSIHTSAAAAAAAPSTPTPDHLRSPSLSSPSYRPNPADQNPPCNTLYVGNLPPFTSEDELRQLFSKCVHFKRLLFRNKNQQGPMCFVEFDDVAYASQAMNELQGYSLSNSVKGGIRLSFSKNPLFTKPNKQHGKTDFDPTM